MSTSSIQELCPNVGTYKTSFLRENAKMNSLKKQGQELNEEFLTENFKEIPVLESFEEFNDSFVRYMDETAQPANSPARDPKYRDPYYKASMKAFNEFMSNEVVQNHFIALQEAATTASLPEMEELALPSMDLPSIGEDLTVTSAEVVNTVADPATPTLEAVAAAAIEPERESGTESVVTTAGSDATVETPQGETLLLTAEVVEKLAGVATVTVATPEAKSASKAEKKAAEAANKAAQEAARKRLQEAQAAEAAKRKNEKNAQRLAFERKAQDKLSKREQKNVRQQAALIRKAQLTVEQASALNLPYTAGTVLTYPQGGFKHGVCYIETLPSGGFMIEKMGEKPINKTFLWSIHEKRQLRVGFTGFGETKAGFLYPHVRIDGRSFPFILESPVREVEIPFMQTGIKIKATEVAFSKELTRFYEPTILSILEFASMSSEQSKKLKLVADLGNGKLVFLNEDTKPLNFNGFDFI